MESKNAHKNTKALSIRQPWLEMILRGEKSIELRKWTTDYRGLLWLHSPMKMDMPPPIFNCDEPLFVGGYIGCALLRTILSLDPRRWEDWRGEHCDTGPYVPGFFGWVLSDVVRFREPLPAPGRLGLFEPTREHINILLRRHEDGLSS